MSKPSTAESIRVVEPLPPGLTPDEQVKFRRKQYDASYREKNRAKIRAYNTDYKRKRRK